MLRFYSRRRNLPAGFTMGIIFFFLGWMILYLYFISTDIRFSASLIGQTYRPNTEVETITSSSSPPRVLSTTIYVTKDPFDVVLSELQLASLRRTVDALVNAFDDSRVTFWLDGGALLGSYRHHDLIPWDGDVDFVLIVDDIQPARSALESLRPEFDFCEELYGHRRRYLPIDNTTSQSSTVGSFPLVTWRVWSTIDTEPHNYFYKKTAAADQPCPGLRYPYVDINLADENETHIWLALYADSRYGPLNTFPKSGVVFPLLLRPLGRLLIPTPCNTGAYLGRQYGSGEDHVLNTCSSPWFNHANWEYYRTQISLPCSQLADRYPFVVRHKEMRSRAINIGVEPIEELALDVTKRIVNDVIIHERLLFRNQTTGEFIWFESDCFPRQ